MSTEPQKEPTFEDDVKQLSNHETFARFISYFANLREEAIDQLHGAPSDRIQQISGRILAYDELLRLADWAQLQRRHGPPGSQMPVPPPPRRRWSLRGLARGVRL
jgi:hypothetical protein